MDASSGPSLEQIKAGMRAQWMAGDFGMIAKTIARAAERFIDDLQLAPGTRVLDVACGTGNTALPLARAGCHVTGVDIAPNLLEQARARAADEDLAVTFDEGDAEDLPYQAESFDAVVSMFGAMFAPRPEQVVHEFARVLKPGGLLAMANWNPDSFSGAMFRVTAQHAPPPPGLLPPVLWGEEKVVRERLMPLFDQLHTCIVPLEFDLPLSPAGTVSFFRTHFGPTKMAFDRLPLDAQQRLSIDLEALWAGANDAPDPTTRTLVKNEYLEIRARKK